MIATSPGFDDFTKMATLYNRASPSFRSTLLISPVLTESEILEIKQTRQIICAKEGFQLLGYTALHIKQEKITSINELVIDPRKKHQGIDDFLLSKVEEFARGTGCIMMAATIHQKNKNNLFSLQQNGFEICNQIIEEYPYSCMLGTTDFRDKLLLAKHVTGNPYLKIQR